MDASTVEQYQEIENFDDVINLNDSQAIFMDGRYYISTNTKAILLPENDNQYVINDTGDILYNDTSFEAMFDNTRFVHYVNNPEINDDDQSQIIYYTNDVEPSTEFNVDNNSSCEQLSLLDNIEPTVKRLKVGNEYTNLDSLLESIDNTAGQEENGETEGFQYIVEFQNYDGTDNNSQDSFVNNIIDTSWNESNAIEGEPLNPVDISKITGKNLLTGQTVTLDTYLEKVRNSSRELTLKKAEEISQSIRKRGHTALSNLLNKKLTIGKTATGQRLVGKVIHVGKKETDEEINNKPVIDISSLMEAQTLQSHSSEQEEGTFDVLPVIKYEFLEQEIPNAFILTEDQISDTLDANPDEMLKFEETECQPTEEQQSEENSTEPTELSSGVVGKNTLAHVSKTLTNLMLMESISKKLKRKNLLIKVAEKIKGEDVDKVNVTELKGYLEMQGGFEEEGYEEKWVLKLNDEKDNNNGDGRGERGIENRNLRKFPETTKLTVSISQKNGIIQSTKVNLNTYREKCSICSKLFKSTNKLRTHLKLVHQIADGQFYCHICDKSIQGQDVSTQHRQYHIDKKELFPCQSCDKLFLNETKLKKHMFSHNSGTVQLDCNVCGETFSRISSRKKHMLTHSGSKPFTCNQCYKQFFTADDLNYHTRVHDTDNCYVCKVCNRTFSRYSNLQRHAEIHGTKNSNSVYSCSICGCTYNYGSSLTRHIVQNHISPS